MVPPGTVDPGPVHPAVGGPSLTHGRRGNIAPPRYHRFGSHLPAQGGSQPHTRPEGKYSSPRYHRFGSHLPAQGGPSLTRGLRGGIGPPGIP